MTTQMTSTPPPRCIQLRFDHDTMWVELTDGRNLAVRLSDFPRLLRASHAQRRNYTIGGGGSDLHWDSLNEAINVQDLMPVAKAARANR